MEIRRIAPREFDAVRRLLTLNGWGQRDTVLNRFEDLIERSPVALVALEGDEVVGFVLDRRDGTAAPERTLNR